MALAIFFLISTFTKNGNLSGSNKIAIIESVPLSEFRLAANGFEIFIKAKAPHLITETWLFKKNEQREHEFWDEVVASRPSLIVTIGTQATKSAVEHVRTVPIIFTMTLEDFTHFPSGISNYQKPIAGVSISIPIERQLELLLEALPMVRRLGILYSSSQENLFKSALEYSKREKVNLIGLNVRSYKDIPTALKKNLPTIDGLILPPDSVIYQPDALQFILRECFQKRIPVTAFSEQLAIAGAPLAIGLDYEDIGRQTAELVIKILSGQNQNLSLRQSPQSILLYINEGVSARLGLYFSRRVLDKAVIVGKGNRDP